MKLRPGMYRALWQHKEWLSPPKKGARTRKLMHKLQIRAGCTVGPGGVARMSDRGGMEG